jgi:FAD/FMN-containing dehydrogenase
MTTILENPFTEFRSQLHGTLLEPHEPGFNAATQGWGLGHQHHPKAVLLARDTANVVSAVQFAKAKGLPIAVQSTGHGFVRAAKNALLINVSQLEQIVVDPIAQTAKVQAGASWAKVLEAAHVHGLTGLVGDTPSVGAVGYTLGGGTGWFARKYGLGCDALLELQIVTTDGVLHTINAESNPELFWGLRGGAGGLGIVTEITIRLFPEHTVTAANIVFPLEAARNAAIAYRDWVKTAPNQATSRLMLMHGPDVQMLPPFLRGKTALMLQVVYSGGEVDAANALLELTQIPNSIAHIVQRIPPTKLGEFFGAPPAPTMAFGRAEQLSSLPDEALEAIIGFAASQPAPFYMLEVRHLGGAVAQVADDATAFAHRRAGFLVNYHAIAFAPFVAETSEGSVVRFTDMIEPFALGTIMPNFVIADEGLERDQAAYPGVKSMQLSSLKARFDPSNLLRFARTPGSRQE